ncbi:MAG: Rossmann-like domain-containing protein [Anaerovoracaceae bacterium]|jgi:uncharacterized protein (DUF4213/DUF364 family)
MRIAERVYRESLAALTGRTIKRLQVGLALIAVELDDGKIGVTHVPREEIPMGTTSFPYAGEKVEGMEAKVIAKWIINDMDPVSNAVGGAVLCAASRAFSIPDEGSPETIYGLNLHKKDHIGMVGFMPNLIRKFQEECDKVIVFDNGQPNGGDPKIYPTAQQDELLPGCDIVIITGTAVANGTVDHLLSICGNARNIIIAGPSTPMIPGGWIGTPVTHLAGVWWDPEHADDIFDAVGKGANIQNIKMYMTRKLLKMD